ncbi:ankyrin repeat-containing domain protein [Tuber borchii]|uniref:Ankyrin repeat-containing domain protein n=1 Tax=Tuber borchii TaxID=42251 RepID=A0A2T6ZB46_TUBBO|nr:ankyrin repeat-containing domain protein [Tuber borchii]
MKMLLRRKDVIPSTVDKGGRTPLSWAAQHGIKDMVKTVLKWKDIAPDTADEGGRTPLSWAAGNGNGCNVKMLLKREDVTPDTADKDGRTPLSWAVENGDWDTVKMLLKRKDVSPDTADKDGRTPPWYIKSQNQSFLRSRNLLRSRSRNLRGLFWEREHVAPDTTGKGGQAPPPCAEERRPVGVVGMLPERCTVGQDTVVTDLTDQTALTQTSQTQHGAAIKQGLKDQDSVPQAAGSSSSTDLPPSCVPRAIQHPSKRIGSH